MNVAIIPARGGSKRIPRKNIKEFCGEPMISWPIVMAKKSKLFERIIVSTDDDEIAEISKFYGAEVPFKRPKEISDDFTSIKDVIAHSITWMHKQNYKPKAVCCIYATSVFIDQNELRKGLEILSEGNWLYAFSVTDYASSVFRSFTENPDGGVKMLFPEHLETRTQDLPVALHDAAQFYWGKPEGWLNYNIFDHQSYLIKIPRWRTQDIDTKDDWERAELLFKMINRE